VLTAFYAQQGKASHEISALIGVKRGTIAGYGRDYGIGIIDLKRRSGTGNPPVTSGWTKSDGA